jgi:hypothetical protein
MVANQVDTPIIICVVKRNVPLTIAIAIFDLNIDLPVGIRVEQCF